MLHTDYPAETQHERGGLELARLSPVSRALDTYRLVRQVVGGARALVSGSAARGDPGTPASASYGYAVWMRHLVRASQAGRRELPLRVAELGPGNNIVTGLAALLSGARSYRAFDTAPHADLAGNLRLLDELSRLFRQRAPIATDEFPRLRPPVEHAGFPHELLDSAHLRRTLAPARVEQIRRAMALLVESPAARVGAIELGYHTDWNRFTAAVGAGHKLDLVLSQAVMQYVDDLDQAYRLQHAWLRPGGWISHQIDFSAHETGWSWYAHWTIPELAWRVMQGGKAASLNRQPFSAHVRAMERAGFRVTGAVRAVNAGPADRQRLAPRFRQLLDTEDLRVSGALLLGRKPG